jgi:hypothetical protein
MANEATAALGVARKAVTDRTAARQHAVTDLSVAEDRVLLAALVERAKAADTVMLDLVTRISTVAKRQHRELPWVASHKLRTKLTWMPCRTPAWPKPDGRAVAGPHCARHSRVVEQCDNGQHGPPACAISRAYCCPQGLL